MCICLKFLYTSSSDEYEICYTNFYLLELYMFENGFKFVTRLYLQRSILRRHTLVNLNKMIEHVFLQSLAKRMFSSVNRVKISVSETE